MSPPDRLKAKGTVVVSDSSDFSSIAKYKPQDATTDPSLILIAAKKESSCPFLELPTELRLEVYRYLLISEDPDKWTTKSNLHQLRHTSSQLAQEAEDIYWSENIFSFHPHDSELKLEHHYFFKWLHQIPRGNVARIRRVSVRRSTRKLLFGRYHTQDYTLASSTVAYDLDLTNSCGEQIVTARYPLYHQKSLKNCSYMVSYPDLLRVARTLFLRSGQICVTELALVAFFLASMTDQSSEIFWNIDNEGERVRRSRMVASVTSRSPTIKEWED